MVQWRVPAQPRPAAVRSGPRTGTAMLPEVMMRLVGKEKQRPATEASQPVWISPARPPAVSWPWPCGFGTRSWLESLWGWGSWRTLPSPRWRGTVSDGTFSPVTWAERSWRESGVFCCSCVSEDCKRSGWGVLEVQMKTVKTTTLAIIEILIFRRVCVMCFSLGTNTRNLNHHTEQELFCLLHNIELKWSITKLNEISHISFK